MGKNMPLVKVVTSVFNGEKYIKEQVDSVLKQTYPNIELYIRDNCSTDHTLEVLQEYEHNPNVHIITGDENVGCTQGYFTLLRLCGEADYYAYCDCDDVWLENKVELAIELLDQTDSEIPVLYCSARDVCDENLNFLNTNMNVKHNISFQNCLVDDIAPSSTYVFNRTTREILINNPSKHAVSHDHWTYMVCQGLGKVIFDPRPLTKYRRHSNNVTQSRQNRVEFIIWRIKHFLIEGKIKDTSNQIQEYSNMFSSRLSDEDRKILELFTKRNFYTALRKVFYTKMFRHNLSDEIMLRGLFLMGVL